MVSYLEKAAEASAYRNRNRFDQVIAEFGVPIKAAPKEVCLSVYEQYKKLCIFDAILSVSYLFEDDSTRFHQLEKTIRKLPSRESVKDLYLSDIGEIYKRTFQREHRKLSAIQKIDDVNEQVRNLHDCVMMRIHYHNWCRESQVKYNVKGHEHEILLSLYLYRRILDVQRLLNSFWDRYKTLKEQTRIKREQTRAQREQARLQREQASEQRDREEELRYQREDQRLEDLTVGSTASFSEEPFTVVGLNQKRSKHRTPARS